MKMHTFGNKENPVAIILHPMAFSAGDLFNHFKLHFKNEYYFIVPDMGNHGENEAEFVSIDDEIESLQKYLLENGISKITLLYGASLGAAGALVFLQKNDFEIEKIYLDGAPVARLGFFMRKIFAPVLILTKNSMRKNMQKANAEYVERYGDVLGNAMGRNMLKLSDKSIKNIALACVRGNDFSISKSVQEKITFDWGEAELYTKTSKPLVEKIYPKSKIIVREKRQHCEYMAKFPKEYIEEIEKSLV